MVGLRDAKDSQNYISDLQRSQKLVPGLAHVLWQEKKSSKVYFSKIPGLYLPVSLNY